MLPIGPMRLFDNYVTITFFAWESRCHVSSRKCDWLITHESEAPRPSDVISEKVYWVLIDWPEGSFTPAIFAATLGTIFSF